MESNPKFSFQSLEEIAACQLKAMRETVVYLSDRSPFYQAYFAKHNIDLSKFRSLSDLAAWPTVSKSDLQKQEREFYAAPVNQIIDYCSTSGTEGRPLTVPLTEKDLRRLAYNERQSFEQVGATAGDIFQLTTTIDRQFMAGRAYMEGARALGAGMVRTGSGLPQLQWEVAMRLNTSILIAVPSFILRMLDYAEANGIDFRKTNIRKAICIGEPIRNADFSMNALGRNISSRWPIELYSTYASTEMATAFTECSVGAGGHIKPELIYIEILDEAGREMSPGEPGELTITTFGIEGLPLLRFRTGDICAKHISPCPCGNVSPRLGPIIGRKSHLIKYRGTTLYPPALFAVLDAIVEVAIYQIEVSADDSGGDRIKVKYALRRALDAAQIADRFRSTVRVSPELELLTEELLTDLVHPKNNRKALKFVDLRPSNY